MQKVVRDSSKYKIDSVIAALQAYGQMLTDTAVPDEPESPYTDRGIVVFGG
jgi:phage terminase large subunit-like protein